MGTILKRSDLPRNPIVLFAEKEGSELFGTLLDKRAAGKGQVYEFQYEKGDVVFGLPTGKKDSKGQNLYEPVIPNVGTKVAVFSDKVLSDFIGVQTEIGRRVRIKFLGWGKGSGPNPFKRYEVEVF